MSLDCSFCGKRNDEVKVIVAGPNVFICDECVELCVDIVNEEIKKNRKKFLEQQKRIKGGKKPK